MFKRIVVPLDGSGRAERALPVAARLARNAGSPLVLVRVIGTDSVYFPSATGRPILDQPVGMADVEQAEGYLNSVAGSEVLKGLSVQSEVLTGFVAPSILTMADQKQADLIVMCSHGYTGVTRWWLMGSVAEKIARFSDIPVLVLREGGSVPDERHEGDKQPLRVLVPLDGSNHALAALTPAANLAIGLAGPAKAAIHLTNVVKLARRVGGASRATGTAPDPEESLNMAQAYLTATLQQVRDGSVDHGLDSQQLVLSASSTADEDIAQGILNVAEDGNTGRAGSAGGTEEGIFGGCDAIAMTTNGFSGLQRWVGSVTERVLHTTRLPLLIVRPADLASGS